mgnify:CR=1 FL=1
MKRLAVILFSLILMTISGSAMAYTFDSGATQVAAPDWQFGERWTGGFWDCWSETLVGDNAGSYVPNQWGSSDGGDGAQFYSSFGPENDGSIYRPFVVDSPSLTAVGGQSDASMGAYLQVAAGETMSIQMDNFNLGGPQSYKNVFVNIRFRSQQGLAAPNGLEFAYNLNESGIAEFGAAPGPLTVEGQTDVDADGWKTVAFSFTPECENPWEDWITVTFQPQEFDAEVDWISVETQCVSAVPVPAAVWLLGSGLLGLIGLRRRNKTA